MLFLVPIVLLAFLQTSSEEMLFRGYLLRGLACRFRRPLIWAVLPGLLFTSLHWNTASTLAINASVLVSIAAFGLTSLICGLADDVSTLIVARFLQGLSGGAMLICQLAVLSHEFREGRERAVAWGWWGVI
ncbi:CPBP family intramembrane metalloprotease, partial [Mesorhizobium sp. M1C.F.Ca.ET.189.01.1.1]